MSQMPPGLFNVRGYDRSVYKTSSVIYTVIPRRGPWNFRFICSFFSSFFALFSVRCGTWSKSSLAPALTSNQPPGPLRGGAPSRARGEGAGMLLTWGTAVREGHSLPERVAPLASPFSADWFLTRVPVTGTLRVSGFPPPRFPSPSVWPSRGHFRLWPSPSFPPLLLPEAHSTLDLRVQSSSQRWVPTWLSCLCSTSALFPSSHWRFCKANVQKFWALQC